MPTPQSIEQADPPPMEYEALANFDPHGALEWGIDPNKFSQDMELGIGYKPGVPASTRGYQIQAALKGDDLAALKAFMNTGFQGKPGEMAAQIAEFKKNASDSAKSVKNTVEGTPGEINDVNDLVRITRAIYDGVMPAYPIELITQYLESVKNQPQRRSADLSTLTPGQRAFAIGRGVGALVGGQGLGQAAVDVMGSVNQQQAEFDKQFESETAIAQQIREAAKAAMEAGTDAWRTQAGLAGNFATSIGAQVGGLFKTDKNNAARADLQSQKDEQAFRRQEAKLNAQAAGQDRVAKSRFSAQLIKDGLAGKLGPDAFKDPEILALLDDEAKALVSNPAFLGDVKAQNEYFKRKQDADVDNVLASIKQKRASAGLSEARAEWVDDVAKAQIYNLITSADAAIARANRPETRENGLGSIVNAANSFQGTITSAISDIDKINSEIEAISKTELDNKGGSSLRAGQWQQLLKDAEADAMAQVTRGARLGRPKGKPYDEKSSLYENVYGLMVKRLAAEKRKQEAEINKDTLMERVKAGLNPMDQALIDQATTAPGK